MPMTSAKGTLSPGSVIGVIPAAGLGTRFLPVTKAQPKEMLPIIDKPAIQYVVEEAIDAGIDDILIIIGKGKRAIEDHFDRNTELELILENSKKYRQRRFCPNCFRSGSLSPKCKCGAEPLDMPFDAQPLRKKASKARWKKFFRRLAQSHLITLKNLIAVVDF